MKIIRSFGPDGRPDGGSFDVDEAVGMTLDQANEFLAGHGRVPASDETAEDTVRVDLVVFDGVVTEVLVDGVELLD